MTKKKLTQKFHVKDLKKGLTANRRLGYGEFEGSRRKVNCGKCKNCQNMKMGNLGHLCEGRKCQGIVEGKGGDEKQSLHRPQEGFGQEFQQTYKEKDQHAKSKECRKANNNPSLVV